MPPTPRLVDVTSAEGTTRISWSDGTDDAVTPLWLRDACHCTECRAGGGQRRFDVAGVAADLQVARATLAATGVAVTFSDGHEGAVPASALARRRREPTRPRWDADHARVLRGVSTSADGDLSDFLHSLDRHGVALARGLETRSGAVVGFASRFAHVRETNYGVAFDVAAEPDPANLANSGLGLALHTDNPYRDPVPTVQLLHCIVASGDGGTTLLTDGWAAAERLARINPRAHARLAHCDVSFRFRDGSVDLQARGPLIQLDADGAVIAVRVNSRSMEPPDLPSDELDTFYAAYRAFVTVLADPDALVAIDLTPGDVLAIDNRRVLHGRTAFATECRRLLQGCYVDIDAVRSAVRVGAGAP